MYSNAVSFRHINRHRFVSHLSECNKKREAPCRKLELHQIVRTAQKAPGVGKRKSSNRLTSLFERRQFCFELNPLVVVEIDKVVNEATGSLEGSDLRAMDTLRFEN